MSQRIIECVPNFSEGRDKAVIRQITAAIEASGGVKLLDVDPGEATNRTVVTFVGEPEAVLEAAFAGVKRASELIDMRNHHGAHPRMGATDVLPLIPIAGITLEEYNTRDAASFPQKRYQTADEYARSVVFMCSPANSAISGQVICVDGGMTTAY